MVFDAVFNAVARDIVHDMKMLIVGVTQFDKSDNERVWARGMMCFCFIEEVVKHFFVDGFVGSKEFDGIKYVLLIGVAAYGLINAGDTASAQWFE